jgi:hypothetical protein
MIFIDTPKLPKLSTLPSPCDILHCDVRDDLETSKEMRAQNGGIRTNSTKTSCTGHCSVKTGKTQAILVLLDYTTCVHLIVNS